MQLPAITKFSPWITDKTKINFWYYTTLPVAIKTRHATESLKPLKVTLFAKWTHLIGFIWKQHFQTNAYFLGTTHTDRLDVYFHCTSYGAVESRLSAYEGSFCVKEELTCFRKLKILGILRVIWHKTHQVHGAEYQLLLSLIGMFMSQFSI